MNFIRRKGGSRAGSEHRTGPINLHDASSSQSLLRVKLFVNFNSLIPQLARGGHNKRRSTYYGYVKRGY